MSKIPTEWYPWPMEQTLSREAIKCVHDAIRANLIQVDDFAPLSPLEDELWNCANHIRAWLERQPVPKDTLLL
jgi:hypothetical protein